MKHRLEETEEEVSVEMTDLGLLDPGENSLLPAFAPILLTWQRSPKARPWVRRISRVGTPLLLIVLFSLNHGFSLLILKSLHAPAPPPKAASMPCLIDAAWSRDSHVIAVLGYPSMCFQAGAPGVLTLYDIHSHKQVARLHPDAAIVQALGRSGFLPAQGSSLTNADPMSITYVHVIWSPDGKLLACTFHVLSTHPPQNGVVLIHRGGGPPQVVLQNQSATAPFYAEWDVARSQPVPFTPPPSALSLMPLSPALAYRWEADGTLVPETVLTSAGVPAAPAPGPVGNPDGDPTFSLWQPGSVDVTALADAAVLMSWSTTFAAWSPDGRYLVDGLTLFGLLKLPGQRFPSSSTLVRMRMNQVPLLPLRDRALPMVVKSAIAVAWSPDGRVLAASHAGKSVELYECRGGRRLASLVLPDQGFAAPTALRWSPDGSHVLVASLWRAMITLWDPQEARSVRLSLGTPSFHLADSVSNIIWTPDGTRIIISGDKEVEVVDVATRRMVLEVIPASPVLQPVWASSPDGTRIASLSRTNTLQIWDAATGRRLNIYQSQGKRVNVLAWSPDSHSLAIGTPDGKVEVWRGARHLRSTRAILLSY